MKLSLVTLNQLCRNTMNWNAKQIEAKFCGTRTELLEELNKLEELEIELFFSGFFCENPIVALATDGNMKINKLNTEEKILLFIRRGLTLCYLTNHEPGFVVKPFWHE